MARIVLAALFSLLLIGMQREVLVHEVGHLRAQVERGHEAGWQKTAGADCLECALLASGSGVIPAAASDAAAVVPATAPRGSAYDVWPAAAAPAYYQSRAPPNFL